ncbi:MAG: hypothetical protein GY913_08640 [Proteobacteria bacterium]|nr:hypothetical protein [Pseudomonadota bacterium]MCP4916978.1 hypothetical protein [Pseudomonadota bacterium]
MPMPAAQLAAWREAGVELDGQVLDELPLKLQPMVWVFSAQARQGTPGPGDADRHAALIRSLRQSRAVFREVRLTVGEHTLDAVLVRGITRAKAVQLAYKRKQWAVLELRRTDRFVVYTGINSRM